MIWLIKAHSGHNNPYYINDYERHVHHRIMQQKAQKRLKSQENVDATFIIVA